MSGKRRSVLEKKIQADIEADIGAEPDLLLMRNSVGVATFYGDGGKQYHVAFGLGSGSPDLVAILRVTIASVSIGVWFCLEVKPPEGDLEPEQEKTHAIWRGFGAIVETVRSAAEARAALERTRAVFRRAAA